MFTCVSLIASVLGLNVYGSGNRMIIHPGLPLASDHGLILKKTKKRRFMTAEVAVSRLYQAWQKGIVARHFA